MPDYRRWYEPGSMYFFTFVTQDRRPILCTPEARSILRRAMVECRTRWPFETTAIVLLPDHLHAIWSLPRGDSAYSKRWAWIKRSFSVEWVARVGTEAPVSVSRLKNRRRGVLQRRFWEHLIRDEVDLSNHIDYVHYNPVKYGLVRCAREWPHSTFHREVRRNAYPPDWGCARTSFNLDIKGVEFDV